MENDYKPPRKRHTGIAFLLACLGLFSLICAADLFASNKAGGLGWTLIVIGVALIGLAMFLGAERL
jgi:uncharacterized membrane protein